MSKRVSAQRSVAGAIREDKKLRTLDAKAQSTQDSFQNFAAKMGIGTDNLSSGGTYGFNPITRVRPLVEWIHRGTWIGGVAVDIVGDDMTRAGVSIKGDELSPEDIERIQEEAVALRVWAALNDNTRWSRVYGGSVAVHLVDGQQLNTPLRIETVRKGQYKGLITLDRWMLDPSLNDLVTEFGPHLGKPKYYTVNTQAPALRGQKIHYSRVIRMDGVDIPYTQRLTENLWGLSIYERLYDRMLAFDSATTGAAQLVYKSYLRTYAVDGLRELVAAGGPGLEGLTNYVQTMARFQSVEGIALIDGADRLEESGAANFGGLGEALLQFGQQIAGALQIPLVRLFGQSPAGMSATGESDLRMYYDGIKQQQEKNLRIPVTNTFRMIAQSLGIDVTGGFRIEFNPLWQLSEAEKASISQTIVATMAEATAAGIMTKQAALKEIRRSADVTDIGAFISNEDIEAAEDEIPPLPTEVEAAALKGGEIPKEDQKLLTKGKDHAIRSIDAATFKESEHPRARNGQFGNGSGGGATAKKSTMTAAPADRKKWPKHLAHLVVPPAWKDVRIATDPKADLLVVGKDVKGRGQYLYSEKFKASQQAKKFARVKELSKKFAAIKKENDANRKRSETRDQADLTALIMSTGIRPGGESNTKADKKAYGATTLQARHVTTVRGVVHLRFVGKKGVALDIPVHDASIAKMLLKRKDAANENLDRLFTTSASELSAYSNSLDGGGFKTKDFRTCLGTSVALEHIAKMAAPTSAKEYKSHLKAVATAVSERLGNTPAIALASYINPTVFEGWKGDWA